MAIFVRGGLHFDLLEGSHVAAADDTTELCGVRILGPNPITIVNVYRPPIRATNDDREDHFDPTLLPSDNDCLLVGDINGHHPSWDNGCAAADEVGDRIAGWLEDVGWVPLNSGAPTFASYRSGGQSAPDLAACSADPARRAKWTLGEDMGSDHLPMVVELRGIAGGPRRIRKTRPAYKKADWVAFRDQCEAALSGAEPPQTVQQMSTLFTETLQIASTRCIPRGARADPRPWALDPRTAGGDRGAPRSKAPAAQG